MTVGNFFQDYPYLTLTKSAHGKLQSLPEKGANIHCSWTEWHGRQLLEMRLRRIKQKMRSCKHQDPPNPTPTRYSPTPELLLPVTNAPRRPLRPKHLSPLFPKHRHFPPYHHAFAVFLLLPFPLLSFLLLTILLLLSILFFSSFSPLESTGASKSQSRFCSREGK